MEAGISQESQLTQAVLGVAGEFVRGSVTTHTYERENPKSKIDLVEFKNIIQKMQWKAFNRIRQEVAEETDISEIEIKLINAAIVDVKIDGYKITNPLNFQGKQLTISIFNAYAPLVHLGALQSIAEALNLELLFVAAEPYAIAKTAKTNPNSEKTLEDAIFIDIGGGTTDIAVVRREGIDGIKSLALGGKAFTKRLAQAFDLGLQEAEEIKLKYSQGEVGALVKKKISSIFSQDIQVWLLGVQLALEEFAHLGPLPIRIFLCGGASLLPGIKKSLASDDWWRGLSFTQTPRVDYLDPADIAGVKDMTGELVAAGDVTPLSLAGLALELVKEENHLMKSILRRTIKLVQN
jgi:cell division protein FtsA